MKSMWSQVILILSMAISSGGILLHSFGSRASEYSSKGLVCEHSLTATKVAFMADSRFHWFEWPDLHRYPPNLFPSKMAVLANSDFLRALPSGIPPVAESFYVQIFQLLRDRGRVFDLLKLLESDIVTLAAKISKDPSSSDRIRAYRSILEVYETEIGVTTQEVSEFLSPAEIKKNLARGAILTDHSPASAELRINETMIAKAGSWIHTRWVHRLQFHLIFRDAKLRPALYPKPAEILAFIKYLGEPDLERSLDWSNTGLKPKDPANLFLFEHLFDTHENNPSSPGFFWQYFEYWPQIPQI